MTDPKTDPEDVPMPTTREELQSLLIDANTQLALQIVRRIRAGDIGTASWLKEARGYLKDQGISLDSMQPTRIPSEEHVRDLMGGLELFTPGVHHSP